MIPQSSTTLRVGVVVVLVLTWGSGVLRPSIKWRSTIRSVEMDRTLANAFVDEPHDCFPSFLHHEGRAGRDAIIANECCSLFTGVNLLRERLDLDLVVIDGYSG